MGESPISIGDLYVLVIFSSFFKYNLYKMAFNNHTSLRFIKSETSRFSTDM